MHLSQIAVHPTQRYCKRGHCPDDQGRHARARSTHPQRVNGFVRQYGGGLQYGQFLKMLSLAQKNLFVENTQKVISSFGGLPVGIGQREMNQGHFGLAISRLKVPHQENIIGKFSF